MRGFKVGDTVVAIADCEDNLGVYSKGDEGRITDMGLYDDPSIARIRWASRYAWWTLSEDYRLKSCIIGVSKFKTKGAQL